MEKESFYWNNKKCGGKGKGRKGCICRSEGSVLLACRHGPVSGGVGQSDKQHLWDWPNWPLPALISMAAGGYLPDDPRLSRFPGWKWKPCYGTHSCLFFFGGSVTKSCCVSRSRLAER